nr:MAG TPA: hypothetical protein [Caudoviricetes sp.]
MIKIHINKPESLCIKRIESVFNIWYYTSTTRGTTPK